jgi:serine/threonine protein kinase
VDPITLATLIGTVIAVLGFLYLVFIGQKSLPEVLQERREKRKAATPLPPASPTPEPPMLASPMLASPMPAPLQPDALATPQQTPAPELLPSPAPKSERKNSLIGQMLGQYHIVEQIGVGGMATVYKAYQASMDRYVAVKVLPHNLAQITQFTERFEREAKAIARLEHPHILPAYDFGEEDGITFIAVRYMDGGTLKDRMAGGMLPLDEVSRVFNQIGGALDYAHRMGVIHRDLKPSNVLLNSQGDVFLADFGLARILSLSQQTTGSSVIGTPAYMSPEQGQGLKADHRSDIYSLGVMLYEMVTGHVPYEAETPMGVVLKHIRDPLPSPRTFFPDLSEPVESVILKAMAKEPNDRYQSAAEMVQALTAAMDPLATPQSGSGEAADSVPPPSPESAPNNIIIRTPSSELPSFIAGPPIIHPARFFGRERELKRLSNLLKQLPLQNAALIGPRRSGKTSLLHYLKNIGAVGPDGLRPGQRASWIPEPGRYRWLFVDFQNTQLGTRDGLLRHLLAGLGMTPPQPCDLDHFIDLVSRNLRTPAVILLDEVGVALQRYRAELDNAFWESLRSLATNQVGGNLAFVLASHEPPSQLAQYSDLGSPFFNIFGYTATLGPLTEAEARELIASSPIAFPDEDAAWILEKSGRWPMLLQILCRERLVTLEDGEAGGEWREDALRQMSPFQHLLQ